MRQEKTLEKSDFPLVSILLPVHNNDDYLEESLRSLSLQSYKNIEIIALDDNSKDRSFKILRQFAKKDKRIRAYRNIKRYGIATTLNRLVKKAKGNFIAFMDAGDISSPRRIRKQVNFLLSQKDVVAVGTQCIFIKDNSKKIGKSDFPKENSSIYQSPLHGISMQFETVLINKSLLPKDLLKFNYNSSPFIYTDFLMKLLPYGKFSNLADYLYYHRNHPNTYLKDLRNNPVSLIKLYIKSIALYNYSFSIRSFFAPFIKSV